VLGAEHVRGVGQRWRAVRDGHGQAQGDVAGQPGGQRLAFVFGRGVPKISSQFAGAELAAFGAGAMLLPLDFDDADLPEMRGGFAIQLIAEAFALRRIGDADQFENGQVQRMAVWLLEIPQKGDQIGAAASTRSPRACTPNSNTIRSRGTCSGSPTPGATG